MAKPRVFISSTYYDLKHIRSSLKSFVESLGFEVVLAEKGNIPYSPDTPLDESCYREIDNADILVLIVGGRYGSSATDSKTENPHGFYEKYDSITKREYEQACQSAIPTYILVERGVYAEYQTYIGNPNREDIQYAHVDSINVYRLMDEIRKKSIGNPIQPFEHGSEIEGWLREQWAGLFKSFLMRRSTEKQFARLSDQVTELREVSDTLRKYLEAMMQDASPEVTAKLIQSEVNRLMKIHQRQAVGTSALYDYATLGLMCNMSVDDLIEIITQSQSPQHFQELLGEKWEATLGHYYPDGDYTVNMPKDLIFPLSNINGVRRLLGLEPFPYDDSEPDWR